MGFLEPTPTTQLELARRAWQQVLGQLRATLSRADFETWVRDVQVLAYDGQVLTLGVANAYARDWLADHLRTQTERLLRQHLGAPVQVVFRVAASPAAASGTIVPQAEAPPTPALDLAALHQRLREAFRQGHRVVFLPGYFLRWIPWLGTRAAWLYVALRQTYFLADPHPHGPHTRLAGQAVEVTRDALGRWAHLTPRTINNLLNRNRLAPLVKVERDRHLQANRQAPNRYVFTADMPLTPADRDRVLAFLRRHGWPENPVGALARALEAAPHGLIPTPQHRDISHPTEMPTEAAATGLRDLLAAQLPAHLAPEIRAQVLGMAELLETTLVETWGKLFISWYFIHHHLPRLGHTFAWLYLIARHLAERQGRAVGHGFRLLETTTAAAAAWVGLNKTRYVRDLIPAVPLDAPADLAEAPPDNFLRRLPGRGVTLTLAVQTVEPLDPADHRAYRLAMQALSTCVQRRDFHPLHALRQALENGQHDQARAFVAALLPSSTETPPADHLLRAAEALAQLSTEEPNLSPDAQESFPQKNQKLPPDPPIPSPGSATTFLRSDQNLPAATSLPSSGTAKNFPHLNPSLTTSTPQENVALQPQRNWTDSGASAPTAVTTSSQASPSRQAGWSWDMLTPNPHLNPKVLPALQRHPPHHLVAWLLYACAQANGVEQPLGLAIHHTLQGKTPGNPYDRLAQLPPDQLRELIRRHLEYGFAAARTVNADWAVMAACPPQRLEELYYHLTPEDA